MHVGIFTLNLIYNDFNTDLFVMTYYMSSSTSSSTLTSKWYKTQMKPAWAPPSYIFSPVWSILYTIIAITFGTVFYKAYNNMIPHHVIVPFVLNLIFNLSFTYLQFTLKNNFLASIDIILILGTLIWAIFIIAPYIKWVAIANLPYLAWVTFAMVLQLTITWMNK